MNLPVREIKWKGLTDKNSDKLYAPKQFLPQSDYEAETRKYLRGCLKMQEINRWRERRN